MTGFEFTTKHTRTANISSACDFVLFLICFIAGLIYVLYISNITIVLLADDNLYLTEGYNNLLWLLHGFQTRE